MTAALLGLLILMFSGRMRAHIKVFFNHHFFSYKYDYRKEWLDMNRAMVDAESTESLREGSIKALSDIVESSGGALWVRRDDDCYYLSHERNTHILNRDRITSRCRQHVTRSGLWISLSPEVWCFIPRHYWPPAAICW